ncbi:MAG: YggT family protein [Thermoleophilia bacterium]|jgi:YggT family protein|nr:YggT family protein [Thermoleophilia bacterium]
MSAILTALTRNDVAQYVDSLFLIYIILIFARIVLSWVITFRGSIPYNPVLRSVTSFIEQVVDPYLNLFRRFLPPIGGSRMALDLSPIIGILALVLLQGIIVGLINE